MNTIEDLDIRAAMAPKSDQINADDLFGGPITVQITGVKVRKGTGQKGEQLVDILISGGHKPYRPCKSMMRVLSDEWGTNAAVWIGRWITLFREPTVAFGGDQVGGIRISHMSHLPKRKTLALTVTRGQRKPYTVEPLKVPETAPTTTATPNTAPMAIENLHGWIAAAKDKRAWTDHHITMLLAEHGSPDGKPESLPPEKRRDVVAVLKGPPPVVEQDEAPPDLDAPPVE